MHKVQGPGLRSAGIRLVVALVVLSLPAWPPIQAQFQVDPLTTSDYVQRVVDLPAAWFTDPSGPVALVRGANNTTATATATAELVPLTDSVSAQTGSCSGCTASHLDDDDADVVTVTATGLIVSKQGVLEATTASVGAPWDSSTSGMRVSFLLTATGAPTVTLRVKNVTSGDWDDGTPTAIASETTLSLSISDGVHWRDGTTGATTVRLHGDSCACDYDIIGDHLEVFYETDNETTKWTQAWGIRAAGDEPGSVDVSAIHRSFVNENRFTRADLRLGTSDTRILLYANDTIEVEETVSVAVAPGSTLDFDVWVDATAGTEARWRFDVIVAPSGSAWEMRYAVTWVHEATV